MIMSSQNVGNIILAYSFVYMITYNNLIINNSLIINLSMNLFVYLLFVASSRIIIV